MQAAVEAARALPFPFTLTARAENFLHGRNDLDDTIKRLQAFEAVGADVLYSPGLYDIDTIRTVVSSVGKPFNLVMGFADPTLTVDNSPPPASSASASAAQWRATRSPPS